MAKHQFIVSKFIRLVLKYCNNNLRLSLIKEFGIKTLSKDWVSPTKTKLSEREMQ